jgi:glucosamine-6-phosphate deaminase
MLVNLEILKDKRTMGICAAEEAARVIRSAIRGRGRARIIAATGASQFEFLEALSCAPRIDWKNVTLFHLDEYIGLDENHPASFRRYLRERFIEKVGVGACHLLNPDPDPFEECRRVGALLMEAPVDVAFVGIGENGHLAFNDPPADFQTEEPYLVVELDLRCRQQQLGEGWFHSLEEVPTRAVSMSVRQILRSGSILCMVPDRRKAEAVRASVEGPITPAVPASILQAHPDTRLYLDPDSASLLRSKPQGPAA